ADGAALALAGIGDAARREPGERAADRHVEAQALEVELGDRGGLLLVRDGFDAAHRDAADADHDLAAGRPRRAGESEPRRLDPPLVGAAPPEVSGPNPGPRGSAVGALLEARHFDPARAPHALVGLGQGDVLEPDPRRCRPRFDPAMPDGVALLAEI